MSILIKDMKMPKDCNECRFSVDGLCYVCAPQSEEERKQITSNYCPLVPIPPHGRLIDADKLKEEFPHDEDWDYPVNTNSYVVEMIDKSPTIIKAEESK